MRKTTLLLGAAALSFIVGCDQQQEASTAPQTVAATATTPKKATYQAQHQASLLKALPSKTLSYLRIPNLAGLVTTAQSDALYPALSNPAIQAQGKSIVDGLSTNLLSSVENQMIRDIASAFLTKQAAPIEVAMMAGAAGVLTPEVLLQTKLNLSNISELETLLEHLTALAQGQLQIRETVDDNGNFQLAAGSIGIYGFFDMNSKDLVMLGGPAALASNLEKYRNGQLETRADVLGFEQQFDSSGAGFAYWADTEKLWQELSPMAPPEIGSQLEQFNLPDTKFIYAGSSAKDGNGSMRLHVQYKEGSESLFHFATAPDGLNAAVALPVDYVASLPVPNRKHLIKLIELDRKFNAEPSLGNAVKQLIQTLKKEYQLDLRLLLRAFGGNAQLVSDRAGTWASLAIQNQQGFDQLLSATQEKLGANLSKRTVAGMEITHYVFPGITKLAIEMQEDAPEEIPAALMQLLAGENMHLYWVREGNNLIISDLPQVLIARERHKGNTSIAQWLNTHGVARNDSLLALAIEADDLPKTAYHVYLQLIQSLSDVAGVEANLIALPLAEDLGLADTGRLGLALNTGKTATSITLDYEQSPVDFLLGGNAMTAIAVVGILAAVAVPAYQDYAVRARGSEALAAANQLKLLLEEYYISNDKLPSANQAEEFVIEIDTAVVFFDADAELIRIIYTDNSDVRLAESELTLKPSLSTSGGLDWICSNVSAPENLIPAQCRN